MRRLLPYLAALVIIAALVGSNIAMMWRAADLSGSPVNYLVWKLLVGTTFPGVLAALGAILFLVLAAHSTKAAVSLPIAITAITGAVLIAAATPIASALIGPLTPAGEGTVISYLHTEKTMRTRQALVVIVERNDNSKERVNAFVTNGAFPSGSVPLAVDRNGKTWVSEPPITDSIKNQGQFQLLLAVVAALFAPVVATRYLRRNGGPRRSRRELPGS